jgi:hypothetical protein
MALLRAIMAFEITETNAGVSIFLYVGFVSGDFSPIVAAAEGFFLRSPPTNSVIAFPFSISTHSANIESTVTVTVLTNGLSASTAHLIPTYQWFRPAANHSPVNNYLSKFALKLRLLPYTRQYPRLTYVGVYL